MRYTGDLNRDAPREPNTPYIIKEYTLNCRGLNIMV